MQFKRIHNFLTYCLVITGLLIIYFSEEVPVFAWKYTIFFSMASIFIRPNFSRYAITTIWNSVTIMALVYLLLRGISEGNYLLMAIYFSLVMMISKLFQRRNAFDYYQIYALSFLHVIGGAIINPGISFGLLFIVYVVLITWCLILVHMRREIEGRTEETKFENHDKKEPEPFFTITKTDSSSQFYRRDLISPALLLGTSILALIIFFFSMMIFFLFPRLGLGFFSMKTRKGTQIAGFSEKIELGHFGTIKDDDEIIMRVIVKDTSLLKERGLRMRGISLDYYDGAGGWKKSLLNRREMGLTVDGMRILPYRNIHLQKSLFAAHEVYLEPLETDIKAVFGIPRIIGVNQIGGSLDFVKKNRSRFVYDEVGDLSIIGPADTSIAYTVFSFSEDVYTIEKALREETTKLEKNKWLMNYYLQLPSLDPRIKELALNITRETDNNYDAARAIENYLKNEFSYTTEIAEFSGDPLINFLFKTRSGHCEYFATSMAIMLRTIGIPSRVVNGFYGGEWNEYGQYYAIKKGNAHSWVEVLFGKYEWITFEPTPSSGLISMSKPSILDTLNKFTDSIKLKWYQWIIEYNIEKQVAALRAFFTFLSNKEGSDFNIKPLDLSDIRKFQKELKEMKFHRILLMVLCFAVLLLILKLAYHKLKKKQHLTKGYVDKSEMGKIYDSMLKILLKRGYKKKPALTAFEFLKFCKQNKFIPIKPVEIITQAYTKMLFARRLISVQEIRHVRQSLKELKEKI